MAGRPRQFDRDQVLDKAIVLFWQQGFEATGIAQLSDTLGIGRQSLYGTFGDKRTLFIEAITRYADENHQWLRATLFAEGRTLDHVHRVLDAWQEKACDQGYCGCFMANAISELGYRDPEMAELLAKNLARMTDTFETAIEQCKAQGDLPPDTNSRALAKTLVNTAQGLSSAGKVDCSFAADVVGQVRRLLT